MPSWVIRALGDCLSAVKHEETKGALAGVVRAVPIILGYLPIGFAFGVLASTAGLSIFSAAAMSLFLYAGSAQLISVGLIETGASVAAITMTVFLVNLRHMLMSAYLAPYLGKLKTWQQALFAYEITDESFAVHSAHFRRFGVPPTIQLFTLNLSAHLGWLAGTILGAWLGNLLSFDTAAYGIDFALPAMFIALLVMQMENRRHLAVALLAASLGLFFYLLGMSQLYIILATIIAAALGALLQARQGTVLCPSKEMGDMDENGGTENRPLSQVPRVEEEESDHA
jgi:4-azaleucine resistance transporter AzlC